MGATATTRSRRSTQRREVGSGRAGRIRWDRLGRMALLGVFGMILLLYLSPAKHWLEQSRTRSAQQEELSRLNAENASLKRKVRAFSDPASLEQEARRLGMVKRGERSYVIENPPGR